MENLTSNIEGKIRAKQYEVQKGRRPLKMPKNYDFSVRNVNWLDYSKDYLLRTDAVWEK